jgi:phosphatidylserine/phosphatidylglycerophosphate/cardiolipin synthase-like enzyme
VDLSAAATEDLLRLRDALAAHRLTPPVSGLGLRAEGLEALVPLAPQLQLAQHLVPVLNAVLAERRARPKPPELVWTGPEARSSAARDTAVVLAGLFAQAQHSILLAGFAFDHSAEVLRPLHTAMARGVSCRIYADQSAAEGFIGDHWPFGPPFPDVHSFQPPAGVFASLHAKCVVADNRWVLITSANFTDRGQTRNIDVGVLLEDAKVAAVLETQFVAGAWFTRR